MTEKTDPLLIALRDQFTRATRGDTRARTATFINANLRDLGQREWLESYSLDGGQTWALKKMVWSSNGDKPTIRQIEKDDKDPLNFGAMLYHLEEYERGQDALSFLRDEDDTGAVAGAPLFYAVAAEEGIPQNAQGRLIVPQQGQIVGSGEYPVEAFAIAAKRAPVKPVIKPQLPAVRAQVDSAECYPLTMNVRNSLNKIVTAVQKTADQLDDAMLASLGQNKTIWPFVCLKFKYFENNEYSLGWFSIYRLKEGLKEAGAVDALYAHAEGILVAADLLARRLMLSGVIRSLPDTSRARPKIQAEIERIRQNCVQASQGMMAAEKMSDFLDRVPRLDHHAERAYIRSLANELSSILSSDVVRADALRSVSDIAAGVMEERSSLKITGPLPVPSSVPLQSL